MPGVEKLPLPENALHRRYAADGSYTDCYSTVIDQVVSHGNFVEAFYTTWLFKLERWILGWTVKKRSNDAEARWVAHGDLATFAAWTVEARAPDQLLMCDFLGATRSWFMVAPEAGGKTRLYFGTVVAARQDAATGKHVIDRGFRVLMGFHRLYSRALLRAAAASLMRGR
jgi:hypothetical protein